MNLKPLDATVYFGICVLAFGVALSVTDTEITSSFARLDWVTAVFSRSKLPTQAELPQVCFFLGAVILILAPLVKRLPIFTVLQINAAFSAILPIISSFSLVPELAIRLTVTYGCLGILIILDELKVSSLWKILSPIYWCECFKGKHGANPLAAIGAEFLVWGYTLMGTNQLVAWCFILVGSVFLCQFAYLGLKEKVPLAGAWLVLNLIYTVGATIKVVPLLVQAAALLLPLLLRALAHLLSHA